MVPSAACTDLAATRVVAPVSALVVDDESHARVFLQMILHGLGVTTVWQAGDGVEALDLYQRHRPTLVLLDVNMPALSGRDTLHRLLAVDPEAVVVMVTSESAMVTVKHFLEAGAMGYVLKQQSRAQIARMLAETLAELTAPAE